jgi:hypothetical protein
MVTEHEEEFRSQSRWLSFKGALFSAVGGASFFGVLSMVANKAITLAAGGAGAAEVAALTGVMPLLVVGGLMAVGAAAIFMAQDQYTQLKSLQDRHQAEENARCLQEGQGKGVVVTPEQEAHYAQNVRADGKKWVDVARAQPQQVQAVATGVR